jgi:hypothetical protein
MPLGFTERTASMADSTVSPAAKREANLRARGFCDEAEDLRLLGEPEKAFAHRKRLWGVRKRLGEVNVTFPGDPNKLE